MLKYKIRDTILEQKLLEPEPFIYPMSAVRDEEIFQYFLDKYALNSNMIIETGSYMGISTALVSKYANVVITFDIVDYKEKYKIWEYFKCTNIIFQLIKNDEEKKDMIDSQNELIDFSWIDGRHHGGIDVDFNILKPYCNKFLFHDYKPSIAKLNGKGLYDYVYTFIESIKKDAKIVDIKEPFIYMEF